MMDPCVPISFILNCHSGDAQAENAEAAIRESFGAHPDVQVFKAENGAELGSALEAAVKRGGTVVAGGGDGTVSTVASKLAGTAFTMGVLPLGTLNHFAKDLKIPMKIEDALKIIRDGQVTSVDVAEVNGRIFVNNSSLGVYPQMVLQREAQQRNGWNKWVAMARSAFRVMRKHPFTRIHIQVDGDNNGYQWQRAALVFIGNNDYKLNGLDTGTRACLDCGRMCLYVTPHQSRLSLAKLAMNVLLGDGNVKHELEARHAKSVRIETHRRSAEVALDGEVVRLKTPLEYRIHPRALNVLVPAQGKGV